MIREHSGDVAKITQCRNLSNILAIDDDEINNEIIQEVLGDRYLVRTLLSGKDYEREINRYHPQLILLDIMMPDINGYELCRKLKSSPATAHIRVIMVSAKNLTGDRLAAYEAGADDYLSKPFVCEELLAKVRVHMRLRYVEELNRLKNDMLRLISHETRTPLNGILGNAWLLEQSTRVASEELAHIGAVKESAQTLMRLIEQSELFLYLQKDQKIEKEILCLDDIIEAIIERNRRSARRKEVRLCVSDDSGCSRTFAANGRLLQIALNNVVDNGIRFCSRGGEVSIYVSRHESQVQVMVTDDGRGVAPELREHIFAPFSVADLSNHTKGSGINLAISRNIARLHGGDLYLDDSRVNGACFVFTFDCQ